MAAGRFSNTATLPGASPHVIFTGRERDGGLVDESQILLTTEGQLCQLNFE